MSSVHPTHNLRIVNALRVFSRPWPVVGAFSAFQTVKQPLDEQDIRPYEPRALSVVALLGQH